MSEDRNKLKEKLSHKRETELEDLEYSEPVYIAYEQKVYCGENPKGVVGPPPQFQRSWTSLWAQVVGCHPGGSGR